MTPFEMRDFLQGYSRELIACAEIADRLPPEVVHSGWLGFEPVSEEQLLQAEQRLGVSLPESLRSFYRVTNGWRITGFFVDEVLPIGRIDWIEHLSPDLYRIASETEGAYGPIGEHVEGEHMAEYRFEQGTRVKRSLVISLEGDASTWLLDPGTQTVTGEWAAGRWSSWNPAMSWQAESFADLLFYELGSFRDLCDSDVP